MSSKKTRHIARRELIVREREVEGQLELVKVASADNLADMFTKVLDRTPFVKLRRLTLNLLVRAATAVIPRSRRAHAGIMGRLRRCVLRCRGRLFARGGGSRPRATAKTIKAPPSRAKV